MRGPEEHEDDGVYGDVPRVPEQALGNGESDPAGSRERIEKWEKDTFGDSGDEPIDPDPDKRFRVLG